MKRRGSIPLTVLEDNTLKKELNGYDEYATRVRHRMMSGYQDIWESKQACKELVLNNLV